eukprot:4323691-Pyramimonas_sp.AAC.2
MDTIISRMMLDSWQCTSARSVRLRWSCYPKFIADPMWPIRCGHPIVQIVQMAIVGSLGQTHGSHIVSHDQFCASLRKYRIVLSFLIQKFSRLGSAAVRPR